MLRVFDAFFMSEQTKMNFIVRGAAAKTELSLVDKIELARTYQPLTGKWMP